MKWKNDKSKEKSDFEEDLDKQSKYTVTGLITRTDFDVLKKSGYQSVSNTPHINHQDPNQSHTPQPETSQNKLKLSIRGSKITPNKSFILSVI